MLSKAKETSKNIFKREPDYIKQLDSLSNFIFLIKYDKMTYILKLWNIEADNIFLFDIKKNEELILKTDLYKKLIYIDEKEYRVENFIPNNGFTIEQFREKKNQILIIKRITHFQKLFKTSKKEDLTILKTWKKINKKLNLSLLKKYKDENKKNKVFEIINHIDKFILNDIQNYNFKDDLNFSHNDLLNGNILFNSEKKKFIFIDFEYSNYNHFLSDLYNIFIESTFTYDDNIEFGFSQNLNFLPNDDKLKEFIKLFLFFRKYGEEFYSNEDSEEDIKLVYSDERFLKFDEKIVDYYFKEFYFIATFQDLYWSIWAFYIFDRPGSNFDYYQFGLTRYNDFLRDLENLERIRKLKS